MRVGIHILLTQTFCLMCSDTITVGTTTGIVLEVVLTSVLLASLIAHAGEDGARAWAEGLVANFARPPKGSDRDQIWYDPRAVTPAAPAKAKGSGGGGRQRVGRRRL